MTADKTMPEAAELAPERGIVVIGLGYVGLPLSLDLLEAGYTVVAVDANDGRREQLAAGDSYVDDVPSERLRSAIESGRYSIVGTDQRWPDFTTAIICVPTPLTPGREPDLTAVLAAGALMKDRLKRGDLVILQSTTYPGTTMGPLRNTLESGGLQAGRDFGLAFAPERVSPGEGRPGSTIPRLVGGLDALSTQRTVAILGRISPSITSLSSPDSAELAKLFENVFRNVNIALVNELALICERLGLDVWEVIRGASTKPFGFMPFYPGPGVGGHCIPVDPYYLSARAREVGFHERFIETAGDINSRMPEHVVELVASALNDRRKAIHGSRVLVLGVAFKPNVSDARHSPADPIVSGLVERGGIVTYHDPFLPEWRQSRGPKTSVDLGAALAAEPDCVVVVTDHHAIDWQAVFRKADLIVDTRNVSAGKSVRRMQVLRLGSGWLPATDDGGDSGS